MSLSYGSISLNQPPSRLRWPQPGNNDFGFVDGSSYSTPDIICHKGATPGSIHAPIAAGSDIKFFWNKWPGPYHKGPVIDYLANCEGPCETVDKTKLKWVKIFEQGLLQAGTSPDRSLPRFAADQLRDDGAAHTARIPEDLAAGNYTFRHEIIALHMANKRNGAQNYPSCFNLEITGDGEARPSGVLGTELYKVDDPGLLLNIFTKDFTSYVIPGPTLYRGGAASSMPTQSLSSSKAAAITKATPSASSGGRSGSSGPKVTQPASSYPLDYGQPQTHETDSAEVSMVDKYATSSASAPDECYGRATTTVTVTVVSCPLFCCFFGQELTRLGRQPN